MTSRFVKKYDAAFFVVVFPEIKAYLPQFVSSLVSQTAHDFDLCIFNDGLDKDILARQFEPINGIVHCNISDIAGTPASIRIDALNVLIEHGYRYAILGDSDDFFSRNRVEKSLELLKHYDVVVNDLNITDQYGEIQYSEFLSKRIKDLQSLDEVFLRDKNVCGFSNAAINLERLGAFTIEKHVLATDWYLFTYALLKGLTMVFSAEAQTFYRQHNANYVGLGEVSLAKIEQTICVKIEHYTGLIPFKQSYQELAEKYANLNRLKNELFASKSKDEDVFHALRVDKSKTNLFWWEII